MTIIIGAGGLRVRRCPPPVEVLLVQAHHPDRRRVSRPGQEHPGGAAGCLLVLFELPGHLLRVGAGRLQLGRVSADLSSHRQEPAIGIMRQTPVSSFLRVKKSWKRILRISRICAV